MPRRTTEMMTLYCERCTFGTELPMERAARGHTLPCKHCGASLHWHVCETCGMGYVGASDARCALCHGDGDLELVDSDV